MAAILFLKAAQNGDYVRVTKDPRQQRHQWNSHLNTYQLSYHYCYTSARYIMIKGKWFIKKNRSWAYMRVTDMRSSFCWPRVYLPPLIEINGNCKILTNPEFGSQFPRSATISNPKQLKHVAGFCVLVFAFSYVIRSFSVKYLNMEWLVVGGQNRKAQLFADM